MANHTLTYQYLTDVHSPKECAGHPCCIHAPSEHHMVEWPLYFREDKRQMERICSHGIGHPDPDDLAYLERTFGRAHAEGMAVHGCDGCCATEMRQCKKCSTSKPLLSSFRKVKTSYLHTCRGCERAYQKAHYHARTSSPPSPPSPPDEPLSLYQQELRKRMK